MNLNIIHLKNREDRLQLFKKEIVDQNIFEYLIWEGVKDLRKPSRWIAAAHQQIIRWAKAQNLSSVLIAEDDIKIYSTRCIGIFFEK